ncbi:MAG: hypothetical protein JWO01_2518, partial [Microbacteriaceae bacterium]|nr:hypothetical protein [Microbacteriaceae bacterium]
MNEEMMSDSTIVGLDTQRLSETFRSATFSRRRVLQVGGAGLLALGVSSLLAACGASSAG